MSEFSISGGGSAGCNALYHLGKRGVNTVLLDKSKLISGTTWHTAGLVWCLRNVCDVEMELLKASRLLYASLQEETNINPGWINNGGLLIARSPVSILKYPLSCVLVRVTILLHSLWELLCFCRNE